MAHGPDVHISPNECMAMQYLKADGYSDRELQMMFQAGSTGVAEHAHGNCDCPSIDAPQRVQPLYGDRLRTLRKSHGMTQAGLASALDVTASTVSQWESGHRTPGTENAWELHRFFFGDPTE